MKLVQETASLARLTRLDIFNCFLVREDDGLTLVDTNLVGSAAGIIAAAQRLDAPLRRIVLTHAHIDHIGSLDALLQRFPGTSVAIGQRESRLLRRDFSLDPGESGKKLIGFPEPNALRPFCLKTVTALGLFRLSFLRATRQDTCHSWTQETVRLWPGMHLSIRLAS